MRMLTAVLTLTALAGCMSTGPDFDALSALPEEGYRSGYEYLWADLHDQQAANAILTHRTVFPHHFEPGSARMNTLGVTSLRTLAPLYRESPGEINVRMGEATPDLYESRVEEVLWFLAAAGVDRDRMRVVDGRMGGEGVLSTRALRAEEAFDGASFSGGGESSVGGGIGK